MTVDSYHLCWPHLDLDHNFGEGTLRRPVGRDLLPPLPSRCLPGARGGHQASRPLGGSVSPPRSPLPPRQPVPPDHLRPLFTVVCVRLEQTGGSWRRGRAFLPHGVRKDGGRASAPRAARAQSRDRWPDVGFACGQMSAAAVRLSATPRGAWSPWPCNDAPSLGSRPTSRSKAI